MKTGFFPDMPAHEYFGEAGRTTKSILMAHRASPAHAYLAMTEGRAETPGMRLGSLVHTLLLEPDQVASRYAVGPDAARNTREWKDWASQQAEGVVLLKPAEYAEAEAMTTWTRRKPTLSALLTGAGPTEAAVLWSEQDAMTGISLHYRGRADKIVTSQKILVDLKTTSDISDRGIERAITTYGYHLQMALYMQGLAAVGQPVDHAVILWVESSAPYEARATLLSTAWLDLATAELATLKTRHAECVASGEWPGYADQIVDAEPPAWMVRGVQNEF